MNCSVCYNTSLVYNETLVHHTKVQSGSHAVGIARVLWLSLSPIVLFAGLIGNSLSLCVFVRKPLNQASSTFALLACLAVSDSLVLLTGLLRDWLSVILESKFGAFNRRLLLCTIVEVLSVASMYCSAWIIVAVSIDRFIAIRVPLRSRSLRTPQRARYLSVVIAMLSVGASLLMTFGGGHREVCFSQSPSEVAMWLDVCGYSLLPSLLLLGFNAAMLRHLRVTRTRPQLTRNAPSHRLSCVAMAVSVSYLLMTLPNALLLIATQVYKPLLSNPDVILVQTATMLLWYSNHAVNFLLYCVTASEVKKALFSMLQPRKTTQSSSTFHHN